MKLFSSAIAAFMLIFAFALPTVANAAGETADANIKLTPRSGPNFFNNAFSTANWGIETAISPSGPFPAVLKVIPMKVADLGFPPSSAMTFNPKSSMPVCPDSELASKETNPTLNLNVRPEVMFQRCPKSLIGNGTAVFSLGKATNPLFERGGEIQVFNGGRVGGLPKIKIHAFSIETNAGIYTEAILQPDGQLKFEIPPLTSDSAVRQLNLDIPGKPISRYYPLKDDTVKVKAGLDPNYVQAKCAGNGGFPWSADFTMGERDEFTGLPEGDPEFGISDAGNLACTGVKATAKIGSVKVTGPSAVKRNSRANYKVVVKNTGYLTAKGVRLRVSGRGIRVNSLVGTIGARKSRTVRISIRPSKTGRIKTQFRVASSNAGSKTVNKTITVRR